MKLTGTGPKNSVGLLFVDWCGLGDDITALPVIAELAKTKDVTVYTVHPGLWQSLNVHVIGVTVTGVEAGPNVIAKEFRCDTGEYLDMYWEGNNLPKYETIYKLGAWGVWEDNAIGGSHRPRFEQLAELLDVSVPESFDYVAALKPNVTSDSYILMNVESRELMRSLTDTQALELYELLSEDSRVVWLSETSGDPRVRCNTAQELIDLVYNAKHVVGIDNGVMHLACAFKKPVTIAGGMTDVRLIFEQYKTPLSVIQTSHNECISPCYRLPQNGFTNKLCCGKYERPACLGSLNVSSLLTGERSGVRYPAITNEQKLHAMRELFDRRVPGAVAEFGVYRGGSARIIANAFPDRPCILFDTFEGIPFKGEHDVHAPGDFSTNFEDVRSSLSDCRNIEFAKGIFPETATPYESEHFAFVYVDADQYQSTKDALEFFWPRLNAGGVIALDDYRWPHCPGVEKALLEFGQKIYNPVPYFAYIKKI